MDVEMGKRLKQARLDANLRPEEMAVKLGVSTMTLHRLEKGTGRLTFDQMGVYLEATGKPFSYFWNGNAA